MLFKSVYNGELEERQKRKLKLLQPIIIVLFTLAIVWTVAKIVSRARESCKYRDELGDELPIYYSGEIGSDSTISFKNYVKCDKSETDSGRGESVYARIN